MNIPTRHLSHDVALAQRHFLLQATSRLPQQLGFLNNLSFQILTVNTKLQLAWKSFAV